MQGRSGFKTLPRPSPGRRGEQRVPPRLGEGFQAPRSTPMHLRTVLLLAVAALPARAAEPKDAEKNKELAALQGVWTLEGFEANGMARDLAASPPRWLIKGNKIIYGGAELAVLTVEGAATPKN